MQQLLWSWGPPFLEQSYGCCNAQDVDSVQTYLEIPGVGRVLSEVVGYASLIHGSHDEEKGDSSERYW